MDGQSVQEGTPTIEGMPAAEERIPRFQQFDLMMEPANFHYHEDVQENYFQGETTPLLDIGGEEEDRYMGQIPQTEESWLCSLGHAGKYGDECRECNFFSLHKREPLTWFSAGMKAELK